MPSDNRGPEVSGVASFFLALTTITILLRCYCRALVVKQFGIEDWSALTAWVFFVLFVVFAILGVGYGTGQHATAIPPQDIPVGLKWWWACEPVYVLSNMAIKFSIGIMLLKIAVAKPHRVIIWMVIVVVEVYSAFFFFLFVLQCRPSAYFWTRYTGGSGTCIDPRITVNATYVYSAVSCAADWTLAIIPIFILWNLQMNVRTKISVGLILAMGAIASTATIIRFPFVKGLANQADFLYATTDVAIWSVTETGLGIAACSMATLRPLFRTFFARSNLWGTSTRGPTPSVPWPNTPMPKDVYKHRASGLGGEVFGLRSDIRKGAGITTTIRSSTHAPQETQDLEAAGSGPARKQSASRHFWNHSESKLTDPDSDEEEKWNNGIRKTTVSTRTEQ